MYHLIRLLSFLTFLVILISDISACKCNKSDGYGNFCGGELEIYGGGSDCGWQSLWDCNGLGSTAIPVSPCTDGCCGTTGINSFCCIGKGCSTCLEPYIQNNNTLSASKSNAPTTSLPIQTNNPASKPSSSSYNPPPNTSKSDVPPIQTNDSGNTKSGSSDSTTAIIASVIGGVSAIIAAIIGVKSRKKENSKINEAT